MKRSTGKDALDIPLLEWICSALGLVLVLTIIGYTSLRALKENSGGPDIVTEVIGIDRLQTAYRVRVRAFNRGGSAAAGVMIQARLEQGKGLTEESEFSLDYLPAHSKGEGAFLFSENPSAGKISVRATAYHQP